MMIDADTIELCLIFSLSLAIGSTDISQSLQWKNHSKKENRSFKRQ